MFSWVDPIVACFYERPFMPERVSGVNKNKAKTSDYKSGIMIPQKFAAPHNNLPGIRGFSGLRRCFQGGRV
jgi:hypothetical protein